MKKRIEKFLSIFLAAVLLSQSIGMPLVAEVNAATSNVKEYIDNTTAIKNVTASSYHTGYGPENAVDGNETSTKIWHTPYTGTIPDFPHWMQVEFEEVQTIDSLLYIARTGNSSYKSQFITKYEVWISPDEDEANLKKVTEGSWSYASSAEATFDATEAKLVRFVALDNNTTSNTYISAAEFKFGLANVSAGAYDESINEKIALIDRVLTYVADDIGTCENQFKESSKAELETCKATLTALLNTSAEAEILAALQDADNKISELLASNKGADEPMTVKIPAFAIVASANSENEAHKAENAVDGDLASIWHSEWQPQPTKRPHELTLDLGNTVLLDSIILTPRQDMSTGRITSGEIYIGTDTEDLSCVATFSMTDATEVKTDRYEARYILIKSLGGTDSHTAIAEVEVFAYDRGYVKAARTLDEGVQILEKAEIGNEVGQYKEADIADFREKLIGFDARIKAALNNSECYAIAEEIKTEIEVFVNKANVYGKEDLAYFINSAKVRAEELTGKDKELLKATIKAAEDVATNESSAAIDVHEAASRLYKTLEGLKASGSDVYDLSGTWELILDSYEPETVMLDSVLLPGSLDENKKGTPDTNVSTGRLSRYYKYSGPATYQREVFIPYSFEGKQITLYMERSRETQVWVNGVEVLCPDTSNVLATAQIYDLSKHLKIGEMNTVTIEVDNSYSHMPSAAVTRSSMATEHTQTNWNGILGKFELQVRENINIDDLRVYPNSDLKTVTVEVDVKNNTDEKYSGNVTVQVEGSAEITIHVEALAGETATVSNGSYTIEGEVKLWSEFDQPLYKITASLENGSTVEDTFGMREFSFDKETKELTINGRQVFLRSEANCAVFPLTAYAPMNEAEWEKLFTTYQSYGINAVRFHSWCPPEAAFAVADRMGLYLQPELSAWDSSNMFEDDLEKNYYSKEAKAIVKEYANHPSFVMLTLGNELIFAAGGYEYAATLLDDLKEQDSTRLYSFGSNAHIGGKRPTANSDFYTGQSYVGTELRGIFSDLSGFINNTYPSTTVNHDYGVSRVATESGVPVFGFEVGQFQVFPDVLTEIPGYTGVLEPRNLQAVKNALVEKGISDEVVAKWINASGMLSRLGYKMEIEAALRTEKMSGISLLGVQDFPGQGTALVGMMNALGNPKPYDFAKPETFATFFSPEVALLEIQKFTWENNETLSGKVLLANYGPGDITGSMFYCLADGETTVAEGTFDATVFTQGDVTEAGTINVSLAGITEAKQLKLTIGLGDIENYYDIWVYPVNNEVSEGDVYIATHLDSKALEVLQEGGKVFISPKVSAETLPESIKGIFTTAFWSGVMLKGDAPGTMGLLMEPEHPVFESFPTEYHSNLQWWAMAKNGRPMLLDSLTTKDGTKIEPLVQVLDCFGNFRTMGLLFEAKVGEGKLMVSSMGLDQLQEEYPEAKALRNSILNYMKSDEFNPTFEVSAESIQKIVVQAESDRRFNVAQSSNGGEIVLGENTYTCQGGYDKYYEDRKLELNDGRVNVENSSRSWSDYNKEKNYPDAEITAVFEKEYVVDAIVLSFFEDSGCKAASKVKVEYLTDSGFVEVSNPTMATGFVKGTNTIRFDAVKTSQIRITLAHQENMGLAISEFVVYEKEFVTINSAEELIDIMNDSTKWSGNYKLTCDIALTGYSQSPIGNETTPFMGIFDGAGYIVSGLNINTSSQYTGLFGYIKGATVKNLTIDGFITSTEYYTGGIVGYAETSTIENCQNKTTVSGTGYVGGVVGYVKNGVRLNGCSSSGDVVSSASDVGGIVGLINGITEMSYCYSTGKITYNAKNVGGMIGRTAGTIKVTNCYSDSILELASGSSYVYDPAKVRAFCGYPASKNFTACYFGSATAEGTACTGIVAYTDDAFATLDGGSGKWIQCKNGPELKTFHVHTEEIIPAVEPTYTSSGLTEGKKCSGCGEILVAQEVIPKLTLEGDIDGNGIVSVADVLVVIKAVLNDTPLENGDLNGDGKVSLIDVLRIMKIVAQ